MLRNLWWNAIGILLNNMILHSKIISGLFCVHRGVTTLQGRGSVQQSVLHTVHFGRDLRKVVTSLYEY